MIYDPAILDVLQGLQPREWRGTVYRHMLANYPPERDNTGGARWNPPRVAARYTSLERETARAEAEYLLSSQHPRPRALRTLYTIRVRLLSVLDLTSSELLDRLGLGNTELKAVSPAACQAIGGAVAWLGHDGLLVPSARYAGTNLVIYPTNTNPQMEFEVVGSEIIPEP
ncbi:MAG: RES family NAD+ phosphorylase [Thermoanaerobaculia bacterium]